MFKLLTLALFVGVASAAWVRVTPGMITSSKTDGVKVTVSTDSHGGARISNDALQGGCGRGAGSAATTYISGRWTKIKYTQDFDGHASCWGIFGDRAYHYGAEHSNLYDMNQAAGDKIYDVVDMSDVKSAGKNARCDNSGANFWHYASGMARDAKATVELRRQDMGKKAGVSTGTSCTNTGNNFWHYTNVWVYIPSTCKTTSCIYSAGKTHVYSKMLNNRGGSDMHAAKPERWHCQKEGSGCKCDCDESLDCKLTHHHTSGYKRSFTHCVVTKAPTAYPTPSPTAYPTSQPTQHCVVGAWGPWSTCNGMIGNVKVWSGGCRHSAYGSGWHFYCLNGVDQNNMSGYGYTHGDSNFRTQRAGWFRINYFGDHHGWNGHWQTHHCRIQVNGRDIFYNHDFKWHDGGWQQLKGDVTWRANANWRFQISIYGSHGYQWHAWNHWGSHPWHSRAQFIYLGSSLKMWSGGCRNHCRHCTGWHTYCLNGQDTWDATHNPSGYMTHDHWKIYVKKTGFFRVNFFAIQHGCPGHWQARILKSGSSIHQTHNYRNWHNGHGWSTTSMDQIWYFSNGHNVQIQLYSPSNSCNQYLWHAWNNYGQHSRVQMTWKGAKVIMWSGGCAHHMIASGWRDYCINRSDFNHCGGNCHADGGSHFYFRKAGFWSVRFYAIQHGRLHHTRVRFQDNHRDILYSHMYKWTNTGWTQISGDLIWYFHANHHMRVSIHADTHGWLWHAWGGAASWSRVQYLFVGTQALGTRIRSRYVTKKAQNGGNICPGLTDKGSCSA